ncbi:hypothetical protein GZH47_22930 [Paenibacillus rhizovicinus]|uniref:Uncharacterized protein n=1 Tax=Paenibacillus rhizovicinus TaxID=2704463 RepID=A0A6C0P4A1_9BACL|nr:hypothetical protein [Paenibacillus rhizovicinus]QHW33364.1 hypothetical protein GZH47_22930 [Paenibacillus rhizovicinus]
MEHNLAQIEERLRFIREDRQDPATYTDSYLQKRNPVTVEGLLQLTMGAPLPVYKGGLVMATVVYWDIAGKRPGLPKDVAALVEKIAPAASCSRWSIWTARLFGSCACRPAPSASIDF